MLGPRRILKDPALLGLVTRVGAGVGSGARGSLSTRRRRGDFRGRAA
jgi:hypothetical protein